MNEQTSQAQKRSRTSLVALLAIFLIPVILAYIVHKNPSLRPGATKNNGILFKPVVTLTEFDFSRQDGGSYTIEQLRGKWALIYIGEQSCTVSCQETLAKARNGIIAQGGEGTRVRYFYITTGKQHSDLDKLKKAYPGLVLLTAPQNKIDSSLAPFSIGKGHQVGQDDRLYLVDPAGNILMHYPAGFKDLGLMEDLKHLLKWSQIG